MIAPHPRPWTHLFFFLSKAPGTWPSSIFCQAALSLQEPAKEEDTPYYPYIQPSLLHNKSTDTFSGLLLLHPQGGSDKVAKTRMIL